MENCPFHLIRSWTLNLPGATAFLQEKRGQIPGASPCRLQGETSGGLWDLEHIRWLEWLGHGPCHSASLVSTCKQMRWGLWMWWLDANADFSAVYVCFSIKIIASGMVLTWKLSNGYQHSDSNIHSCTHKKCAYVTTYTRRVNPVFSQLQTFGQEQKQRGVI